MAARYTSYDGQSSYGAPPVRGDPTLVQRWLKGMGGAATDTHPAKTFTYDGYGNRLTETDECGNLTRTTYDAARNLFPIQIESPIKTGNGGGGGACGQVAHKTTGAMPADRTDHDRGDRALLPRSLQTPSKQTPDQ